MRSLPRLLAAGARLFYRLDVSGRPPARGRCCSWRTTRTVCSTRRWWAWPPRGPCAFLAKHTLFDDPKVGWLVRAAGSVPVYRQQDGPAPTGGNDAMFAAARATLAAGEALGVFGEGVSHTAPHLQPIKTGPARLALGAARELGRAFPLVPVGITLADRATFRSAALVVVGAPVAWDDLAGRPDADHDAVRALTARIDAALRDVTANFDSWADARLVAFAEAVHAAELQAAELQAARAHDAASDGAMSADRLARWRVGADVLTRLRAGAADEADALARDLRAHERLLGVLRLAPADLHEATDAATALGWGARRVPLLAAGALTAVGAALAWPAYRAVGVVAARMPGAEASDVRGTAKFLVGALVFVLWTLLLAAGRAWSPGARQGPGGGSCRAATLVAAPALALTPCARPRGGTRRGATRGGSCACAAAASR
jgi:hypothetical protein